ncbi:PfkB family carbohydrate kinase [Thauera aromatica]|nr:PfkB family carbohydrate kinase [Thauera aromatica]MCK2126742.1 PfkB family carbohydrate kinase [Thauera aromatica]
MRPAWCEIYGSAGRAASAVASMGASVSLHSYFDPVAAEVLASRGAFEGFQVAKNDSVQEIAFDYDHGLATPRILGRGVVEAPLRVFASRVLRFGMMDGDAIVRGRKVVYDPQDAYAPEAFHTNGSTADALALVLNLHEAALLTGARGASAEEMAGELMKHQRAAVVVIKRGALGALVRDHHGVAIVPAYQSQKVWKIGSGDNFAAHFAYRWLQEGRGPAESADLASRATAYYCQTRGFATSEVLESFRPSPIVPSEAFLQGHRARVYLAGPFFSLAQLWLIEQARNDLLAAGLKVFSPYHDVGHGSADDVVPLDLAGINDADLIFAVGDGMDPGTVYEIGYARAKGKPVIVYCENESDENKKMMRGSGCLLCDDYVSSIYQTLWTACRL